MTLGEIIKNYRDEQGISQRRFAELSGLSNSYISMLEKNTNSKTGLPINPTFESVKAVAYVMGLQTEDILRMLGDNMVNISGSNSDLDDMLDAKIMRLVRLLPDEHKLSLLDLLELTVAGYIAKK